MTSVLPRLGRAYAWTVISLGIWAIGQSLWQLYRAPIGSEWLLLALFTLISGSASVKLHGSHVAISVSEAFVFTAVLLYGSAAGTLTVALDGLVISYWIARRRPEVVRALINISAPALSVWLSAQIFFRTSGVAPLVKRPASLNEILPSLALFALLYFGLNSWLIALVVAFEKRQNPVIIWRRGFVWLSLNYFCGASVAILLVGSNRAIDIRVVGATLPLLLVLYFTFRTSMQRVEDANRHVEKLNTLYMSTIETLAMAIDAKDQITHGHIRRVQKCTIGLAERLGITDLSLVKAIEAASLLHDMGKLAVPEYILNKPDKLTPAEFEKMKLHVTVGADILSAIEFPYPVVPIVRHHHENWDGTGYPDGLKGTEIPIGARILAVVDCFDALTSDRPYRPALSDGEAIEILLDRRGRMYDPFVVDTFISVYRQLGLAHENGSSYGGVTAVNSWPVASDSGLAVGISVPDTLATRSEVAPVFLQAPDTLLDGINITNTIGAIAQHVRRVFPLSLFVFYTYNSKRDDLEATHVVGDRAAMVKGLRLPFGRHLSGWVAANRQTVMNSDAALDLGKLAGTNECLLRCCLSTPLLVGDDLVGVLTLYSSTPAAFSETHKHIIETIGRQVGKAFLRRFSKNKCHSTPLTPDFPEKRSSNSALESPYSLSSLPRAHRSHD